MQQRIVGVSRVYPRPNRPDCGVYAHELYSEMARQGAEVSVIAPYPLTRTVIERLRGTSESNTASAQPLLSHVYRPSRWSWSSRVAPWPSAQRANFGSLSRSVQHAARWLPTPDWISAYFFDAGCAALNAFGKNVPVYVEIGESNFRAYEQFMSPSEIGSWLSQFAGVIAVSKPNLELIQHYADLGETAVCLENGVDTSRFKPNDRMQARASLGLPQDAFIVGFTGAFIERKGPLRLLAALERTSDAFGLFMGRGSETPRGKRVLHAAPVSNDRLPAMLVACDVFCLPSLAEGLSVAVLEAAACGLPLVVSDRSFNTTFLDDRQALFVDPLSPESIAEAIRFLMASPAKRQEMAVACRQVAEDHSLAHRVTRLFEVVSSRGQHGDEDVAHDLLPMPPHDDTWAQYHQGPLVGR